MSGFALDTEGDADIKEWLDKLMQKLEGSSNATARRNILYHLYVRISRLTAMVDPFAPTIVSIGKSLRKPEMEKQKWSYMKSVFSRSSMAKKALLKACVHAISDLENELCLWYEGESRNTLTELVETLLVDGCFILELLIRHYTVFRLCSRSDYQDNPLFQPAEDQGEDPIFKFSWLLSAVRRDLALLENQMPFVILHKLFELITGRDTNLPHNFLLELVSNFYQPVHNQAKPPVAVIEPMLHREHLLNILLNIFRPAFETESQTAASVQLSSSSSSNQRLQQSSTQRKTFVQSATSLEQVGVRFISGTSRNLLDIKFNVRQGSFEIPPLHITAWTDSYFRNLIAFERCCPDRKPYVASYLLLMNRLIKDAHDVRLLEERGILINNLGSDMDALDIFNNIGRQIDVQDEFCYQQLCDSVDSSYNNMWNLYKKQLRNEYFRTPWAVISILAAILLMVMTLLQTIYSILYYYSSPK